MPEDAETRDRTRDRRSDALPTELARLMLLDGRMGPTRD
jgi:hypothetical protein